MKGRKEEGDDESEISKTRRYELSLSGLVQVVVSRQTPGPWLAEF